MPPDPFHSQIRAAIADENLQAALDKNAEQRRIARNTAFTSLSEDLQILRQRAHTVRAEVIAHQARYLEQFIAQARANGFIIHRAADAEQARRIVLEIAQQHGARLVAKSKTMVSEEIELNPALQAAGIRPIETDLGEYIVQLRGEAPSHIITPAVHLRRQEVGETFHDKLGIPPTTDISTLTEAARKTLRETFLQADIGLSGVNFGVAEQGAICLVTNEGNGRMVTTVPDVHIALMGIERLVASFDDLALMLTLLPRAATGQQITVYTQIIRGPRRADEIDGAVERHIVLVDNGRSQIRGTALNDTLLCIRCGACLNACPVFREIGGHTYASIHGEYTPYPGPIGSVLSPALFSQENFGHLAQVSTLCGACKEACPVDIDLPTMLLRVRSGGKKVDSASQETRQPEGIPWSVNWGLRLFSWVASSPRRFATAQQLIAVFGRLWSPRSPWMWLPAFSGWGFSKDFPRPAAQTFHDQWAAGSWASGTLTPDSQAVHDQPGMTRVDSKGEQSNHQRTADDQSPDQLVSQFQKELEALSGIFIRCSESELATRLLAVLAERQVEAVVAWEDEYLTPGLGAALRAQGITLHHTSHPEIRVGISGAVAGIAETGTLVVTSGKGQPQLVSLLPEIHIAILKEAEIYKNLAQVLSLPKVQSASSVALISGPSRTADIEMTLTIGVHGPGEVLVFCI